MGGGTREEFKSLSVAIQGLPPGDHEEAFVSNFELDNIPLIRDNVPETRRIIREYNERFSQFEHAVLAGVINAAVKMCGNSTRLLLNHKPSVKLVECFVSATMGEKMRRQFLDSAAINVDKGRLRRATDAVITAALYDSLKSDFLPERLLDMNYHFFEISRRDRVLEADAYELLILCLLGICIKQTL